MSAADVVATPSGLDIGHLYLQLHVRVRKLVDEAMTASGASLSRTKVLSVLADRGPMNQAAIASDLGFAPRSITDVVDSLERDGLAERLDDPTDRRARLVGITPAGSTAHVAAVKVKTALFEQIFSVLDPTSRTELFSLLETVHNSLSPQPGETSCPLIPQQLETARPQPLSTARPQSKRQPQRSERPITAG